MRVIILLFLLAGTASAQFPNQGFENWTGTTPDSWATNNVADFYTTISKSTTAYKGTAAVRGDVVQFATLTLGPYLWSGVDARGFAYAARPGSVQGYYQLSPQGGDQFGVNVILYKGGVNGTAVAVAAAHIPGSVSAYTQFTVPFQYLSTVTPDTCIASFFIYNTATTLHAGTYFLLDELSFSGSASTAVRTEVRQPASFELKQNYPNPFNPSTTIDYGVPASGRVQMKVYDRIGMEVATIVDRNEDAGYHSVHFNAEGLASGVYFVSLRQGSMIAIRSMLLVK
jgi:hypothetical protein